MHFSASYAVLALRMWWPIVALCALLGMAGGIVTSAGAPYRATTLLRVDTSINREQSVALVSTAMSLVDSDPVFARAVAGGPEALGELRARTSVGILELGEIVTISVVAPSPEQAVRDADRFANAATDYMRERAQLHFETLTTQGQEALNEGALQDLGAEEFRRQRIGVDFADAQGLALRSASFVTRVDEVQEPVQLGLPTTLAVAVGGTGGAVAGYTVALVLGVRRRRIRNLSDLSAMSTKVRAYGPGNYADGLVRVAARCVTLDRPLLALLVLPGSEQQLPQVASRMREQLAHEGLRWTAVDTDDLATLSSRGRRARSDTSEAPTSGGQTGKAGADMILVIGVADQTAVNQAAARADVVVLVAARHRTRLGGLASVCSELAELSPTLILMDEKRSAAEVTQPDAPRAEVASPSEEGVPPAVEPTPAALTCNGHAPSSNGHAPASQTDGLDYGPVSVPALTPQRPSPRPRQEARVSSEEPEPPDPETANHDTANHDTANHDTANHDTANHDTANHDTANQETSAPDGTDAGPASDRVTSQPG